MNTKLAGTIGGWRRLLKPKTVRSAPTCVHSAPSRCISQIPSGPIPPMPKKEFLGITKLFIVATPFLYIGGMISMYGASLLEDYDIFVPEDDDDDWCQHSSRTRFCCVCIAAHVHCTYVCVSSNLLTVFFVSNYVVSCFFYVLSCRNKLWLWLWILLATQSLLYILQAFAEHECQVYIVLLSSEQLRCLRLGFSKCGLHYSQQPISWCLCVRDVKLSAPLNPSNK